LFNQPHSARAATPWQPNAGIAKKLSSRGYTTTSWTSDEPEEFAELGYPAKSSGFSAAHYQPTKQPLSQQAQASLALLEGEYRNESFGKEKPASVAGTETNEHLPFVMDAYGATRKTKLRVNVAASVLERALAQAEMAESLVVSPITSDEKVADPIVIHPDVPDVQDIEPMKADETSADDTTVSASADTEAADVKAQADVASADEESTAGDDVSADSQDTQVESQEADDVKAVGDEASAITEPQEPDLPAVVGGIPPEEVAQREAEQFAKGLAQAREEAQAELAQAVEKAMQEGLAKGLEQGKTEGLAEGLQQGLEQGQEQGKAEGETAAREAVAEEMAAQRVVFENAAKELGALIEDPKKFFEPLKRLAVHIAEQMVVGELQASSKAIERLVQRCLDELDHPVHGAVVLELNPEDKARLQEHGGDFIKGMRLEAVPEMQVGSVRVFANDTVVEDLVEHRLEGLARAMLVDEEAWRAQSPLVKRILKVQEEEEDGDVHS
jgi:flagellar biosynthesis/type III secretory pathway protein FliH